MINTNDKFKVYKPIINVLLCKTLPLTITIDNVAEHFLPASSVVPPSGEGATAPCQYLLL